MKISEFIKLVLSKIDEYEHDEEIAFQINLNANGDVSNYDTGCSIKFTLYKENK